MSVVNRYLIQKCVYVLETPGALENTFRHYNEQLKVHFEDRNCVTAQKLILLEKLWIS